METPFYYYGLILWSFHNSLQNRPLFCAVGYLQDPTLPYLSQPITAFNVVVSPVVLDCRNDHPVVHNSWPVMLGCKLRAAWQAKVDDTLDTVVAAAQIMEWDDAINDHVTWNDAQKIVVNVISFAKYELVAHEAFPYRLQRDKAFAEDSPHHFPCIYEVLTVYILALFFTSSIIPRNSLKTLPTPHVIFLTQTIFCLERFAIMSSTIYVKLSGDSWVSVWR